MSLISEMLEHNQTFVASGQYESFLTDRYPDKKLVVVTCMDTRLVELLPRALNLRNGDAKVIKNAGAIVSHPFGSVMRSILVAVYNLQANEVAVIGHHDCGMTGLNSAFVLDRARERGVTEQTLAMLKSAGIDLDAWLRGFESSEAGVRQSVAMIRQHPLMPPDVPVHGLVISPETGKVDVVEDGYANVLATAK
jgi:carbonic anhydrase